MASLSFTRMATSTAATKRPAAMNLVDGLRSTPVANLSGIACTPIDPVDAEVRQRLGLDGPHKLLESFIEGTQDVLPGVIFTVSSVDYDVKYVESWEWTKLAGTVAKRIVLEEIITS